MSEWTHLQALKVLEAGDWLNVEHPSFPNETLTVRKTEDGGFVAYHTPEEGASDMDSVAGRFEWGEFAIVGFCWFPLGKPADEEIDPYAWAHFEEEVLGRKSDEEEK